jgi:hypothetical protein
MRKIELTDLQVKEIIKLYTEDLLGSPSISEKLKIHKTIVLNTLRDNGIVIGPSGRRNIGGREVSMKKYESKPETKKRKSENHKNWSEKNKEYLTEYHKKWRTENVDKWRKTKRDYERNRKARDPLYKLINNFRTAIYQVLKENNINKNGHYFEILKYTPEDLISHLETKFTNGMTWDNYGEWHVDHVKPISSYIILEIGDDEFMNCWSLNNLQPLWGKENISKSNKLFN